MSSLTAISDEYRSATEGCALLDRSERGKLALAGPDAMTFLHGQVSNDVEGLAPGTGCYAAFLTPKGKMLGDLRILRTEDLLLLDTERVALQGLFNLIRRFSIGYEVTLIKRTLEAGLLSLVGPQSDAVAGVAELPDAEHAHRAAAIDGIAVRAIRSDVGIDLLCEAADTERLREALLARGAEPVSEATAECVRVEHGRPRYGVDLDETVIPQEAGLNERAVSFTKGCYVGQETVARLYYKGKPNRHLRGLRCGGPIAAGSAVTFDGRPVGTVTSAVESPRFGWIALALIRREAPPGSEVSLEGAGEPALTATVVELPFA